MTINNPIKSEIICGDSITLIRNIDSTSVHLILSDIPYGIGAEDWDVLHNNTNSAYLGSSPAQKKAGSVFKKRGKPLNGWSEEDKKIPIEYYEWCKTWTNEWYRVLVPGASVFIFAGRRLAHRCICAMEDSGFIFKDSISWIKNKAVHRAQRVSIVYERRGDINNSKKWNGWRVGNLRPIYEPILWFMKPYKVGSTLADNICKFGVGAYNQEEWEKCYNTKDNVLSIESTNNDTGLHPTQKPVRLMEALIKLTTVEGQTVLDPFMGSGTTLVAAKNLNRNSIGIEINADYCDIAQDRIFNQQESLL